MKTHWLLLCALSLLLNACAHKGRPTNASNYDTPGLAPQISDDFVLLEKKIFEHPALGTMLRYLDQNNPNDNITIYIYPIDKIAWDNPLETINAELQRSLQEVDRAVQHGHYKSRFKETISEYKVYSEGKTYTGKKAQLNIVNQLDQLFYSDIFVFVAQDKFIKFRTSFNGENSHFWTGDDIVDSILPHLNVPPESLYMKRIRGAHKRKLQQQFLELLIQSSNEGSN